MTPGSAGGRGENTMETITMGVELSVVNCKCGGSYAINERFREKCEEDGKGWHCPYCQCGWGYYGKTQAQKLQEQLDREKHRHANEEKWLSDRLSDARTAREHTKRKLAATKGVVTRIKNRVANGTCPCCDKQFADLARHMQGQHPDYVTQD
jgi:hypothetical protein